MTDIHYRDATPADAARLADLFARSFVETFGTLYAPEDLAAFLDKMGEAGWREEVADPAICVRIVESGDKAIALAKVGPPTLPVERHRASVELRQLYLMKQWHGTGVAEELMRWAIATAKARGAEDLYLSVYVDNHRARRFYEKRGFAFVAPYTFMVGNHADEDHIMRLPLDDL